MEENWPLGLLIVATVLKLDDIGADGIGTFTETYPAARFPCLPFSRNSIRTKSTLAFIASWMGVKSVL